MDKHVLDVVGSTDKKFPVAFKDGKGIFKVKVKLPKRMKCKRCTIQWKYHVGEYSVRLPELNLANCSGIENFYWSRGRTDLSL